MNGLNFLLWTIAVILILGVVVFVAACVFAYHKRNQAIKEYGEKNSYYMDRLKKEQAKQEELIKRQYKK